METAPGEGRVEEAEVQKLEAQRGLLTSLEDTQQKKL